MKDKENTKYHDTYITDFSDPVFQSAFREYFTEIGIEVRDWDGLFREMNREQGNTAIIRKTEDGQTIGFIMYKPIDFTSWFFEETRGFIREFWISKQYRNAGHGSALLELAEKAFVKQGIHSVILTTDTAESFYVKHGYRKNPDCKARNKDDVFVKTLES